MTELRDAWIRWEDSMRQGKRTEKVKQIEQEINRILLSKNESPYDFDARHMKDASMAQSTVNTPPIEPVPEVKVTEPQGSFTIEEAKKLVGDNDYSLLTHANKIIESLLICTEYIAKQTNPINQSDKERLYNSVMLTIGKFYKDKMENGT